MWKCKSSFQKICDNENTGSCDNIDCLSQRWDFLCKGPIETWSDTNTGSNRGPYEKELLKGLLRGYEKQNRQLSIFSLEKLVMYQLFRPVLNESHPLMLTFGITLQQIIDVVNYTFIKKWQTNLEEVLNIWNTISSQDEKNQLLVTCLWLNLVSFQSFPVVSKKKNNKTFNSKWF